MVEIAHTFLFEFVRRGEGDRSREENFRKRVSRVKTSEGVETSRLSESEADVIILRPYGFEIHAQSRPPLLRFLSELIYNCQLPLVPFELDLLSHHLHADLKLLLWRMEDEGWPPVE